MLFFSEIALFDFVILHFRLCKAIFTRKQLHFLVEYHLTHILSDLWSLSVNKKKLDLSQKINKDRTGFYVKSWTDLTKNQVKGQSLTFHRDFWSLQRSFGIKIENQTNWELWNENGIRKTSRSNFFNFHVHIYEHKQEKKKCRKSAVRKCLQDLYLAKYNMNYYFSSIISSSHYRCL